MALYPLYLMFVLLTLFSSSYVFAQGTVIVKASVPAAKVFVDGRFVGRTPVTLKNLSRGEHVLVVKSLGYLDSEEKIKIDNDKIISIDADLLPFAGILTISSVPKGGSLFIDNKLIATLPYEGEISIGKRVVEVKKDGYATSREVLQVGAGNHYRMTVQLTKLAPHKGDISDVPLVAVTTPKIKKTKKIDNEKMKVSTSVAPAFAPSPALTKPTSMVLKQEKWQQPWYQKWWVWTTISIAASAVIVVPIVVTQTYKPEVVPAYRWKL